MRRVSTSINAALLALQNNCGEKTQQLTPTSQMLVDALPADSLEARSARLVAGLRVEGLHLSLSIWGYGEGLQWRFGGSVLIFENGGVSGECV